MSGLRTRLSKLGLLAGYAALLVAVAVAHRYPAAGYELSLYRATPLAVWAGVGVALLVGALVALTAARGERVHDAAVLLVGAATLAVVTVPVLRGYYFYGGGDSLSHVGWAREIAAGTLDPANLLYPGIHTATVAISSVAGVSLPAANVYVVLVAFPLVFLVFVPLAVQLVARTPRALAVGLLVAALFTPLNNVAVHLVAHPASQAILFLPFLLYLGLAYVVRDPAGLWRHRGPGAASDAATDGGRRPLLPHPGRTSGLGALLATASIALLFVHPQQALNLGLCFLAIAGFQVLVRLWNGDGVVAAHRPLHVQALLLTGAFLAWAPRFERVQGAVFSLVQSILNQGPSAGDVVAQKSTSLTALGGSIAVVFLKLFLAATVVSLFAAAIILLVLRRRLADGQANALGRYLAAAIVPVFGVFLLVLAGGAGDMYFRYEGFIMVPVAVLGAAAIALAFDRVRGSAARGVGSAAVLLLFLVLLPAGLVTAHPSPYIYQPSNHLPQSQTAGFDAAFEHRQPGVEWAGIRGGPRRYVDFQYGTHRARTSLNFPGYEDPIRPGVFNAGNYTDVWDDPRYVGVTRTDYEREVVLYDGFRYSAAGFRALAHTPGVSRVRTSDGFDLYRVEAGEEAS